MSRKLDPVKRTLRGTLKGNPHIDPLKEPFEGFLEWLL